MLIAIIIIALSQHTLLLVTSKTIHNLLVM